MASDVVHATKGSGVSSEYVGLRYLRSKLRLSKIAGCLFSC